MENEIILLAVTAASIGFLHTLFGPDHYLPFIMMSKARNWSVLKTLMITLFCGIGHVGSSVIIGIIGIIFGLAVARIEIFEGVRGSLAAWALIAFGLVYMVWGIRQAIRQKTHSHLHFHADGSRHEHEHQHQEEHLHVHNGGKKNITPWVLFTIFVLGPCEPLIPILMYPAARQSIPGLIMITLVFAIVTIATMLGMVLIFAFGLKRIPFRGLEKYTHALAGGMIMGSGLAIQFLGL